MNISSRKIIYLNKHIINHKINVPRKKICREIITDILFIRNPAFLATLKQPIEYCYLNSISQWFFSPIC